MLPIIGSTKKGLDACWLPHIACGLYTIVLSPGDLGKLEGQAFQAVERATELMRSVALAHHIGAIKYFICYYNLTRAVAAALPV